MKKELLIFFSGILIYSFGWGIFYFSGVNKLLIQSEDTVPAMFIPVAILREGTIYLDSYYGMMVSRYPHPDDKKYLVGLTPFYLKKVGVHYLSAFTLVPALLALPVYFFPVLLGINLNWLNLTILAKISSAAVVSLSGVVLYVLAKKFIDEKKAFLLTLVYLIGTINFASISQALWQHESLELFTIIGLLFLVKASNERKNLIWASISFGFAILSRPTALLAFLILAFYVAKEYKFKALINYFVPSVIPFSFFFLYNQLFYQGISNQGYASQILDSWKTPIYKGFLGLWLSPSKGMLVYSPVFIFSLVGIYLVWKKEIKKTSYLVSSIWYLVLRFLHTKYDIQNTRYEKSVLTKDLRIFRYLSIIVLLHTLIVGMWKHWYGGWSFGYRMASDIIPYLVLLLIPYFKSNLYEKTRKIFYICFAWSIGIEIMGLAFFDGIWHAAYDRGFKNQSWLWSVQNSEMVFYVKRVLVKLGLFKAFLP